MEQKLYMPSLAELIDRLVIVQHKELLNEEHREEFTKEMELILHDIDVELSGIESGKINASVIRDIIVLTMSNSWIWTNEDNVRKGTLGEDSLMFTHQLNDIRSRAKQKIMQTIGGRIDFKLNNIKADNKIIPSGY